MSFKYEKFECNNIFINNINDNVFREIKNKIK